MYKSEKSEGIIPPDFLLPNASKYVTTYDSIMALDGFTTSMGTIDFPTMLFYPGDYKKIELIENQGINHRAVIYGYTLNGVKEVFNGIVLNQNIEIDISDCVLLGIRFSGLTSGKTLRYRLSK